MTAGPSAGETTCTGGDLILSRRQLLAWGATAAIAATLPPAVVAPDALGRESWLRRASYAGRIGETFQAVLGDGRTVRLRLAAIEDLIGTSPGGESLAGREASFLLEFQGPAEPQLRQGAYELRHPALGRSMLFLVPQAPRGNRSRYAVVVNREVR